MRLRFGFDADSLTRISEWAETTNVRWGLGPDDHEAFGLPGDLDVVRGRCAAGQQVLGLRFRSDPAVGTRFDTLTRELGDAFIRVELEGRGHSTVTAHRRQEAVDAVLSFLADTLRPRPAP